MCNNGLNAGFEVRNSWMTFFELERFNPGFKQ